MKELKVGDTVVFRPFHPSKNRVPNVVGTIRDISLMYGDSIREDTIICAVSEGRYYYIYAKSIIASGGLTSALYE